MHIVCRHGDKGVVRYLFAIDGHCGRRSSSAPGGRRLPRQRLGPHHPQHRADAPQRIGSYETRAFPRQPGTQRGITVRSLTVLCCRAHPADRSTRRAASEPLPTCWMSRSAGCGVSWPRMGEAPGRRAID